MPRFRTILRGMALGVVVLFMTGCIKLDMDLKVSSDDKVSGTVVFGFNKQLLTLTGQSASDMIQDSGQGVPASGAPGTTVSPYEDDEFAGERVTYDDVDLSQFNRSGTAESIKITRVGDEFHVSGTLDFSDAGQQDNPLGGVAQQALDTARLSITLTFPGLVSTSNGDIDGNSVTWTPTVGETMQFTAVASAIDTGGGFPVWVLVVIAAAAVLAVGGIVMLRRRKRATPEATAGESSSETPVPPTP